MRKPRSVEQLIASVGADHDLTGFACSADRPGKAVLLRCNLRGGDRWTLLLPAGVALDLCDSLGLAVGAQGWSSLAGSGRPSPVAPQEQEQSVTCKGCDVHSFSDCAYLAFTATTDAVLAMRLVPAQAAALLADLTALCKANPAWRAAGNGSLPSTHH